MSAEEIHEELRNSGKLPVAMRMVNYLAAKNDILENWKNAFFVQLYMYNKEQAKSFADNILEELGKVNEIFDADNLVKEYEDWKKASDWFKDYSISEVTRALESEGVEVEKDSDGNYEISFSTDADDGNVVFYTEHSPKSAEDFASQIEDIADNFDDEEYIGEYLEAGDNGMLDIPSIKSLVHKAEEIQKKLNHLSEVANKAAGIKRVSIKEILAKADKKKKQE